LKETLDQATPFPAKIKFLTMATEESLSYLDFKKEEEIGREGVTKGGFSGQVALSILSKGTRVNPLRSRRLSGIAPIVGDIL